MIYRLILSGINNTNKNIEFTDRKSKKKYLYMGNIIKDNFIGFGLLITPFLKYKKKFSNSKKSEMMILLFFERTSFFTKMKY